tara:strand:- start:7267 stop:7623 length:357 start_codon:yes stop_codon:yes gene_type:complete
MKLTKKDYIEILDFYDINYSKDLPIKFLKNLVEKKIAEKLCSCIKKVKDKYNDETENRAIGICNYSVIQRKKIKIHTFSCKKKKELKNKINDPNGDKIYKIENNININKKKTKKYYKK